MTELQRSGVISALIVSPILVGVAVNSLQPADSVYALGLFFYLAVGIPAIIFIGILTSYIDKRRSGTNEPTLLGYIIPAIIISFLLILLSY